MLPVGISDTKTAVAATGATANTGHRRPPNPRPAGPGSRAADGRPDGSMSAPAVNNESMSTSTVPGQLGADEDDLDEFAHPLPGPILEVSH